VFRDLEIAILNHMDEFAEEKRTEQNLFVRSGKPEA